ncbi:ABC transporter [Streptomyces sp. NPDC048723]|uniref:ABC transporter n=1 Tax=Streptomyces sp. NPDC048723 TaxID=3365589 RepID=UPI0037108064
MTALLRYQGALLLRSQRWLAPLITYAAFVAVGIRPGDPVLDSLGFTAAGLVPATAWLVRICVGVEPDAARACTAAAAGPVRVHAAALLTASAAALVAGAAAAAVALLTGERAGAGPGAAALCSRPLVRRRGYAVLAGTLGSLLALVLAVSPARGAISALVTAGRSGTVPLPLTALAGALVLAAGAGTAASLAAARR